MSFVKDNLIYDAGSVDGSDGSRVAGCQFTTPARTSAGLYTLTLEDGKDATECVIICTVRDAAGDNNAISVVHTSDTVKTINTSTGAGVAADLSFDFLILDLVGV